MVVCVVHGHVQMIPLSSLIMIPTAKSSTVWVPLLSSQNSTACDWRTLSPSEFIVIVKSQTFQQCCLFPQTKLSRRVTLSWACHQPITFTHSWVAVIQCKILHCHLNCSYFCWIRSCISGPTYIYKIVIFVQLILELFITVFISMIMAILWTSNNLINYRLD